MANLRSAQNTIKLQKRKNVPNAEGRFIRMSGGMAEPSLGTTQNEAAAVNGLKVTTYIAGPGTAPHSPNLAGVQEGGYSESGKYSSDISGDAETRPINLTVNYFIRIN